jgi:predicted MFS family arabinose efflux permease
MPHRASLWLLALIQITHVVEFMLMMPLGPQLMRLFSVTPSQFSIAVASYTLAAGISGFAVASIADRFDRKRMLLAMYAGLIVATFVCGFAPTFEILVLARVLAGAFGGVLTSLTYAMVGDLVPPAFRGRAAGIIGVAFPIASTLGIPLSLLLAQWGGWHVPFLVLGLVASILWVVGAKLLPSVPVQRSEDAPPSSPWRTLWEAIVHRNHRMAFLLTTLLTYSVFSIVPFIAPVLTRNGVLPESMLSLAYGVGGLVTLIGVQLIGRAADRFGKKRVFTIANAISLIPIVLMTHATPMALPLVIALWSSFMVVMGMRWTVALALITGSTTPQQRGAFLAVNSSMMQFAASAGTFVSGLILVEQANGLITGYSTIGWIAVVFASCAFVAVLRVRAIS